MNIFKSALLDSPMSATRLLIALSSLTWALFLLWPSELFTRQTYAIMRQIAPENIWAALFLYHGICTLVNMRLDKARTISVVCEALLGCLLWTTSTAACFAAHWHYEQTLWLSITNYAPPAAMSGELWVAVFSWWFLIRQWADYERGD